MLSPEERHEIESELARYPHRRAAAIDAMLIVQKRRGHVSDEAIGDIAGFLEMTPEELDAIATFYNLIYRKPVGRHVILVCDSVSCWICGYNGVRAHLERRLGIRYGETTTDDRFTLLPIVCLGACDRAPALMIDEDLHGDVTPASIDTVLEGYP